MLGFFEAGSVSHLRYIMFGGFCVEKQSDAAAGSTGSCCCPLFHHVSHYYEIWSLLDTSTFNSLKNIGSVINIMSTTKYPVRLEDSRFSLFVMREVN